MNNNKEFRERLHPQPIDQSLNSPFMGSIYQNRDNIESDIYPVQISLIWMKLV